jgi:hypothetical protein
MAAEVEEVVIDVSGLGGWVEFLWCSKPEVGAFCGERQWRAWWPISEQSRASNVGDPSNGQYGGPM